MREEFTLEVTKVPAENLFAIGKFKVPGHGLDAKQIGCLDHVGALRQISESAALPEIATVEQKRASRRHRVSHHIDQGLEMREAAQLAKPPGLLLEVQEREGVCFGAARGYPELLEKSVSNQMRRPRPHRSDADVDAWLPEVNRQQLRVRIGHVQNTRISERLQIVNCVAFRRVGKTRKAGNRGSRHRQFQKVPSTNWHSDLLYVMN